MPYIGAKSGRRRQRRLIDLPVLPPRKEDAPCCLSKRDRAGRLPVGFCSPRCVRRRT